jgi:CubicO group peptidase (beta-lactamase class C family)
MKALGKILHCLLILPLLFGSGCTKETEPVGSFPDDDPMPEEGLYFPDPDPNAQWETADPQTLGWDLAAEAALDDFLLEKGTKAFLILKDGRLAKETYFGSFKRDSIWYWASAGKTLTALCLGIAQEQGLVHLEDSSSDYLGEGWTSAAAEKEILISVRDQLSMSSGLDETIAFDCTEPACLGYLEDAGLRWAYHNAPYTLLQNVVSQAASEPFTTFFKNRLRDPIGMDGGWFSTNGYNNVYFSTARSMARFGLLILGEARWSGTPVLSDAEYLEDMLQPSQEMNQSYGYLWWLNGQDSFMLPGSQVVFPGSLIPAAPEDTVAGLGKNDQKLYVVPSLGLVIVRMGEDSGSLMAGPSSFDNTLWEHLNAYLGR